MASPSALADPLTQLVAKSANELRAHEWRTHVSQDEATRVMRDIQKLQLAILEALGREIISIVDPFNPQYLTKRMLFGVHALVAMEDAGCTTHLSGEPATVLLIRKIAHRALEQAEQHSDAGLAGMVLVVACLSAISTLPTHTADVELLSQADRQATLQLMKDALRQLLPPEPLADWRGEAARVWAQGGCLRLQLLR